MHKHTLVFPFIMLRYLIFYFLHFFGNKQTFYSLLTVLFKILYLINLLCVCDIRVMP